MPPKVKAKAKAKALPKAAGKAKAKAKARVASRRAGVLRRRPARAPLDGAGSPCASPVPEPELFAPVAESRFRREGKYHIKGKYLGVDAEAAVKIDSLVEDSLGKWAQVTLLGTNHDSLRMASSVKCPPVHLKGRRDHRSASDGPRVVLHPRGWRDRREDHMDHQSQRSWFHRGSFRDQPTGPGVRLWGRTRSRSKGEDARRGRSSQSSQSNQAVEKEKASREGKSESYAQRQPMVMEKQRPRSEIQTAKNSVEEEKRQIQLIEHNRDREEQRFRRGRSVPRGGSDQIHTQEMPGVADTSWNQAGKRQGSSSSGRRWGRQESRASICSISSSDICPAEPKRTPETRAFDTVDGVGLHSAGGNFERIRYTDPTIEIVGANCARSTSTPCLEVRNSTTRIHYSREHRRVENSGNAAPSRTQGSGGLEGERQARLMGTQPAFDPQQHQRAEREQRFRRKGNSRERRQGRQGEQGRAIWENSYSGPDIVVDDVSRSPELTGSRCCGLQLQL